MLLKTVKSKIVAFLSIFAVLGGVVLFIKRLFEKPNTPLETFPTKEKKKLEKKLDALEKEAKEIDKKVYTDEEILDYYNGKKK